MDDIAQNPYFIHIFCPQSLRPYRAPQTTRRRPGKSCLHYGPGEKLSVLWYAFVLSLRPVRPVTAEKSVSSVTLDLYSFEPSKDI